MPSVGTAGSVVRGSLHNAAVGRVDSVMSDHNMRNLS